MDYLREPSIHIYEPMQDPNDPRVKNIIAPSDPRRPVDIGIVGAPFDKGVILGGGRAGSRFAPSAIRQALKDYGTTFDLEHKIDISDLNIMDFGDVEAAEEIEETHKRITDSVGSVMDRGAIPVVLGGGHDISIGTVRALSNFYSRQIGGINIDAHFDVREIIDNMITSGTPFRRLLDLDCLEGEHFVEMGAHDNLNARAYYDYLISHGASIFTLSEITNDGTARIMAKALKTAGGDTRSVFVSIDMDSVAQCYAPGSSAPDSRGFDPGQMRELAFLAGASSRIKLIDIVELNPEFDVDGRTVRLAASIIISFLNGFKQRKDVPA